MRWMFLFTLFSFVSLSLSTPALSAADPVAKDIEFQSKQIGLAGMPIAECDKPVMRVHLKGKVDEKGKGTGELVLDLTGLPQYDEFGFETKYPERNESKFDCTFEFVKKTTKAIFSRRLGAEEAVETRMNWSLYQIKGPKIKTPLFVSIYENTSYPTGRFLVQDKDGKVKYAVDLQLPPQPEPCHPGCFPAGTEVRIAKGTTTIERVQKGDAITTIDKDGKVTSNKVSAVFVTRNRLLEVRTKERMLTTTETQPLALVKGGYASAGELKPGDKIWIWTGSERKQAAVESVTKTNQDSDVYNLVLGEPTTFIAGGFLVRSKPPLPIVSGDSPVLP